MTLQWLSRILNGSVLVLSAWVLALSGTYAMQHALLPSMLFLSCLATQIRVHRDARLGMRSTLRDILTKARQQALLTPLEKSAFIVGLCTVIYVGLAR